LENIKSRIDMMKGKFEIVSSKNTGTKINVKIPLNQ
jgi:signal transduction histidine kinase